jgi:acetyl-CoA carboxylase biotin carboxylase subunit
MKKLLVANRGEIALRIMRSAKEMGISTVAIFSEADRNAPFVRFADEAVCIGPAPSSQSYLVKEKIIETALALGVDGIHPGYGFLSENAQFAKMVEDAGIAFIGPSPYAIETMGSKLAAKEAVAKFNVPLVPGTAEKISDVAKAKTIATEIGFPIIIKASAGGGGKGMRIVANESEFVEQMELAVSEAISAFGDGDVFIEKYVTSPRHIEFQILGDKQGNIVYLFDRECSVQRRHQKVVEEAPSSVLTPKLRKQMGEAAVNVGKSCGYYGAGTVEFIVNDKLEFYFLEMNTRLQVEHPVTEMITGLDLVKEQINIAMGHPLPFSQADLAIKGHSIELRVYSEDPENGFLPDIGNLEIYKPPVGEGIRVDDGFEQGMDIPIYYDPMISKLATYGNTRNEAIKKMIFAIDNYHIKGVKTTLAFGKFVMQHPAFISGNFDTSFVEKYFHPNQMNKEEIEIAALAAVLHFEELENSFSHTEKGNLNHKSLWPTKRN